VDIPRLACVSDFLRVFKSRREYCQALLELSSRQSELIAEDDYEQLLMVLGQKQHILSRLEALNQSQPGLWRDWRKRRDTFDPALLEDCEHVLAETESILAELVQQENASTEFLTRRRDAARSQLQSVSHGADVHSAYRDSLAPATHRHLNLDQ
jgi:hypothetical protein